MAILNAVKEMVTGFIEGLNKDAWVKVTTERPACIYYFGPFQNSEEAKTAYPGYVEDLENEGAQGIEVAIERCNPQVLTACEEESF